MSFDSHINEIICNLTGESKFLDRKSINSYPKKISMEKGLHLAGNGGLFGTVLTAPTIKVFARGRRGFNGPSPSLTSSEQGFTFHLTMKILER